MNEISETVARKLLDVVDAGLTSGLGVAEPGKMCVEAAVCYVLGLPHGDDPGCVAPSLRALKIRLNDSPWSSAASRAKGLRRLALVQLGSAGVLDGKEFAKSCAAVAIQYCVPVALRIAAERAQAPHKQNMLDMANVCEKQSIKRNAIKAKDAAADAADAAANAAAYAAAYAAADAADAAANAAAYAAAYAAYAVADAAYDTRDKILSEFAERIVQILIDMKVPGCKWLYLTEQA